jgi:hypothetical protein
MDQRHSWTANIRSASQKTSQLFMEPKTHFRVLELATGSYTEPQNPGHT